MGLRRLLVMAFMSMSLSLAAQLPQPVLRQFTTLDGLPSSQIYQVIEDKKGYLWFATDHGVARYNGYEFKVFSSGEGLSDNTVFKLFIDSKERMWMQTFSGQLFFMENEVVKPFAFNILAKKIVGNSIPLGFFVDSLENVYFSCNYNGEYIIDKQGKEHLELKFIKSYPFNQIFVDEIVEGRLLTSGNKLFIPSLPTYLYIRKFNGKYDSLFVDLKYSGQLFAKYLRDGRMIISLSTFLFEYKNGKLYLLNQLSGAITYLYEGKNNELWVSTYNGLFKVSTKNWKILNGYLEKEFISSTVLDFESGLWVTTVNSGVFYFNDAGVNEYKLNPDSMQEALCLTKGQNIIYVGFWNGVVAEFSTSACISKTQMKNEKYVNAMFFDEKENRLLISMEPPGYLSNGKYHHFKSDGTKSLKGDFIRLRNGEMLNASINGLYKIKDDSLFLWASLKQRANCVNERPNGEFILGTNSGVYLLNEKGNILNLFHPVFKDTRVDDIENKNDQYFFATRGKGLLIVVDDSVYKVDESDGLCSNIIHRITLGENSIWCASYNGASKVTIESFSPFRFSVSSIGYNEGLSDNEINDIAILNDTVWVATKKSILFFDGRSSFVNSTPPVFHFTSFKVNNVDVSLDEIGSLSHVANNISIGFEALSYKSYGKINYRYRLVNEADTFESVTSSRHVEFLSLKPGNYIFSVLVKNSSGTWTVEKKSLKFTILTPFWQQWWFRLSLLLAIVLLAVYFMRLRIARVREQERLRTDFNKQLVMLEMKALRAQMNPHFIFNVINSIQDYILKNDARSAQKYLTKFAKLVRSILDNSVEGEVMLEGELDANKLYVELEQQRFDDKFEFELNISNDVDANSLLIPSMIFQPFLENAIKHGIRHLTGNGKLTLTVNRDDHNVYIYIEDNGIGREAAAELNKINASEHISHGSLITTRRVEAYNKAHNTSIQLTILDLFDEYGKASGTRVELLIPVKYRIKGKAVN
ncbi:MAG: histidine kinase [Bacteroidetes bacterium]|nr:histidine kinase [Bacteroidota bacterium]